MNLAFNAAIRTAANAVRLFAPTAFKFILSNIEAQAKLEGKSGSEKFSEVVTKALANVLPAATANWVAQTVVQVIFAYARLNGLIPQA